MPAGAITVRELVTVLGFRTDTQQLDNYDKMVKRVSERMVDFGKKATLFLTLPITLAGIAAVKMASDAVETQSKFAVVFRDVADEAQKAAEILRDSYLLSRKASQQLLSDTGDLLTGFGFAGKEALDLSFQVNTLAADLASFGNVQGGTEQASKALTKALLGERESVKELGIAILEKDVLTEVEIMRSEGQRFATERQAKAWATLRIAVRQSGNAIGDVARTQFELANQARKLRFRINDLIVGFGMKLLPIVNKLTGVGIRLVEWLDNTSDGTKRLILIVAGLTAVMGPLTVAIFGGILAATTFGMTLLWIPLIILGVIAVLAFFLDEFIAWKNEQDSLLGILLGDYEDFGKGISDFFDGLFTFLFHLWEGHWDEVIAGVQHFVDTIVIMFQDMADDVADIPVLKQIGQLFDAAGRFIGGTKLLAEEAGAALGTAVAGAGITRPETIRLSPAQREALAQGQSININQRTEVNVPVGTTPDQANAIARVAQAAVREELNASARQIKNSLPVED